MASLFGSKKSSSPPAYSLNVQTSVQGLPIPKVWGKTRISGNIIYYNDFTHYNAGNSGSGGKGGLAGGGSSGKGGSSVSYNYQVSIAIGLCQGTIKSVDTVWADKAPNYPSQLGFTIFLGDFAQTAWGRTASLHPDQALAYRGIAYAASFLYLGSSPQLPNLSFEVHAVIADAVSGTSDADPSAIIIDFLTNQNDGVGLPTSRVGDLTNYQNYCRATGMLMSPSITNLTTGQDFLKTILEATNSEAVWSQGAMQVVPRGDQAITAGTIITVSEQHAVLPLVGVQLSFPGAFVADLGVSNANIAFNFVKVNSSNPSQGQYYSPSPGLYGFNGADVGEVLTFSYSYTEPTSYTPPSQPLYLFTDDDYITGGSSNSSQPVQITRSAPQDAKNSVVVNYTDRSNSYALTPTPAAKDDAAIQAYGLKQDDIKDYDFFQYAQAAQMAAHLALGRNSVRNTYVFTVGQKYKLLDPMDLVSLTDTASGLNAHWARILEITENSDATLTMMAEDYLSGTAAAPKYSSEPNGGYTPNYQQDPGFINAPLIFEPPSTLTGGTTELWIAVSGSGMVWGGCDTYVSYDDTNYTYVTDAHLVGPSRQGYVTAPLSTDPAATLSVNISEVNGAQLTTVTAAEAASLATLCYIDGELLAYTTATLTANGMYTLGGLIRGAYGTPIKSHASGVQFARVDQNIIKVPYNKALIGGAIFLKFLSFNIWGNSEQTLSEVTEIEYTFGGGQPPGVITGIMASATQSGLAMTLIASWAADGLSATYQAGISADNGITWQDIYDGSNLSTRADGLKATASLLFRVRGVTSSGIPGVYAQVAVGASGIVAGGSGYQEVIGYREISASVIDAALLPDYNADLAELAQFSSTVSLGISATQALQQANAAAAGVVQLANGQVPNLAASLAAQTTGLTQQVASINSSLMAQIAQESKDAVALGGRIDTLSASIGSNSAFTTGISLAQATINSANAIKVDEVAAQEASDNDSGELADFVNLVQQGNVTAIRAAASNAAQTAIVVQQIANTTATTANALYSTTLASQVNASFANVNQTLTTQATAAQALAARTTTVESLLGDPVTGLSATYSDVIATSAVINDPTYGNFALAVRTTTLAATVAGNGSAITSIQAVNASQDGTIASLTQTITSNYSSLSGQISNANAAIISANSSITNLAQTQTNDEGAIATLSSTVTSNYTNLSSGINATNGAIAGVNQTVIMNSANISNLNTTSANQADAISTLQTSVQSNYNSLSGQTNQNNASIQNLSMTVSSQGGSLATLSTQVSSNYTSQGNAIAQNNSNITGLQQTVSAQGQTLATVSTSLNSTYGGGGNDLANSDLLGSGIGDILPPNGKWGFNSTLPAGPIYNPQGYFNPFVNVIAVTLSGNGQGGQYADWFTPDIPCEPNVTYEMSVLTAFQGPSITQLFMGFKDNSGNVIAYGAPAINGVPGNPVGGVLDGYTRIGSFVGSVAGAVSRFLLMRTLAPPTNDNVAAFFTHPFTRTASPGQQVLSPYSAGTQANVPAITASITSVSQTAASANAATALQVLTLQSQIGDPTTGLRATYTSAAQTTALTNDPTYGNTALANYVQNLSANLGSTNSTISSVQGTVANQGSTLANLSTTVTSNYNGLNQNISTNTNNITTLSNNYGSLSQQVQQIQASGGAGTANGQVIFSAQSAPSGVTARFAVTLNASGQQSATGGFALDLVNGAVNFTVQANTFRVEDPSTRFVPFAIVNGALVLAGVTYINSVIQSNSTVKSASTGDVSPVMAIDFANGSITIYDAG